ncbi:MAG: LacI family transcriptional regulator [Glaciihabitans sp.]|jgi:DNA-binding LacI/PurR family transcriptional regulator|nr:LacI family transcriptional regulator [Glaciihabitans sp.]
MHFGRTADRLSCGSSSPSPSDGLVGTSRRSRATLRDIARDLDLSVSAVSMALLDHPRIGAETKARVRDAANRLGYVTNSAGRALRTQMAGAIAVIVPNTGAHVFGHSYFMHVMTGVTAVANSHESLVFISTTSADAGSDVSAYEAIMRSRAADGAIVTSASADDTNIGRLVETGMPVVLLGRFPHLPEAITVGVDDRNAAFKATEHLIVAHRRTSLVHISGPLGHQTAIDRRDGFLAAAAKHGASGIVVEGDFSEESGAAAVAELDDRRKGPLGLFVANDEMAYGAITALATEGISVPGDVCVVGFDDFGLSRVTTPSITTMSVRAESMARLATERLYELIDGEEIRERHTVLPVVLTIRQSCGCPPHGPLPAQHEGRETHPPPFAYRLS